jgi:uncharacterized protein YuzE
MKMTYDHTGDVLYLELTTDIPVSTRWIDTQTIAHLDVKGALAAIELLNVTRRRIDPLSFAIEHYTPKHPPADVTAEEAVAYRVALAEARKEKQAQAAIGSAK